jgi:glycosyltransferase involved in cell wall biosynthesis
VRVAAEVGRVLLGDLLNREVWELCEVTPSEFASVSDYLPVSASGAELLAHESLRSLLRHMDQTSSASPFLRQIDPTTAYPVRSATAHPIQERFRVVALEALLCSLQDPLSSEAAMETMGELMRQSHESYNLCGLGTQQTSLLVDLLTQSGSDSEYGSEYGSNRVVGAKLSGGGGGGAVVALVQNLRLPDTHSSNSPHSSSGAGAGGQDCYWRGVQRQYTQRTGLNCVLRAGSSPAAHYQHQHREYSCKAGKQAHEVTESTGTGGTGGTGGRVLGQPPRHNELSPPSWPRRVLVVNHGYPPDFNGGSEVYAQTLALQLQQAMGPGSVRVFAREHDPFRADFEVRRTADSLNPTLPLYLLNYPREAPYFRFAATPVDEAFRSVLEEWQPDIVHFHHLNHLSLGLPLVAKESGAKVVYTLHDYWLLCPRGQFLVTGVTTPQGEPWKQCGGQEDRKCAVSCYAGRYATGRAGDVGGVGGVGGVACTGTAQGLARADEHALSLQAGAPPADLEDASDLSLSSAEVCYWTDWIAQRMAATHEACLHINAFVAPSRTLYDKFQTHLSDTKIHLIPYGFDRTRLSGRHRIDPAVPEGEEGGESQATEATPFVFAYIGRHLPAKGINLLVEAALLLIREHPSYADRFVVKIFGRQEGNSTRALQRLVDDTLIPGSSCERVLQWEGEYENNDIVPVVFDKVDCIVVPSVWMENSPLVIQEALQSKVLVITSQSGGMGELIKDGVNGLTFTHRSASSLAAAMMKALEQPRGVQALAQRGYLSSEDGQVPCIAQHVEQLLRLYRGLSTPAVSAVSVSDPALANGAVDSAHSADSAASAISPLLPSPWRVTFDTNPDDCNFKCTMCEQHSEHSPHQKTRKAMGIRRRRMDIGVIRRVVQELAPRGLKEIIPTVCVCVCVCVCVYIYIYICIYVYMCIQSNM